MKLARGSQITIGAKDPKAVKAFTFQLPQQDPITDPDVTEAHELIAKIEKAVEPYKEVVDTAKAAVEQIEEGIRATFRERLDEESTDGQLSLMSIAEPVAPPSSGGPVHAGAVAGEVATKAARKFAKSVAESDLDSVTVTANGKSTTIRGRGRGRRA